MSLLYTTSKSQNQDSNPGLSGSKAHALNEHKMQRLLENMGWALHGLMGAQLGTLVIAVMPQGPDMERLRPISHHRLMMCSRRL